MEQAAQVEAGFLPSASAGEAGHGYADVDAQAVGVEAGVRW